jgi:hypothetical protein
VVSSTRSTSTSIRPPLASGRRSGP